MKKILKTVVTVIGWLVLLFAFSAIGFATDNPKLGVPLYILFFLLVFGGVYYYVMRQRHSSDNVSKTNPLFSKILGVISLLGALLMPYFIFAEINLPIMASIVMLLVTAVMIVIGLFSIRFINRAGDQILKKLIGYLVLIALASVPAIAAISYFLRYFNRAYDALGTTYWCTVVVAILSWWGLSLVGKKK
ncbi:MAG: hypothetical protein K9N06_03260 [Candidatus Cloacimonetes bacterium]|nr:hypothetical protein [Candidatus Cloacimonadota bacterium]